MDASTKLGSGPSRVWRVALLRTVSASELPGGKGGCQLLLVVSLYTERRMSDARSARNCAGDSREVPPSDRCVAVRGTVGKIDIFSNLVLRVLAHCNRERSSIQGHWYQFYHYRTTFTHPMPLHSS